MEELLLHYDLQFFAKEGPGGEKTEDATAKKLGDARKEGQVAKSKEIVTAISLMSIFLMIKFYIGQVGSQFIDVFGEFYGNFALLVSDSERGLKMSHVMDIMQNAVKDIVLIAIPFFAVAVILGILGNVLQQKWMVTTKPLKPKMSKISPISGFKRLFSIRQIFETIKSFAMIAVIAYVVYTTIKDKVSILFTFYNITLYEALGTIGEIVTDLGIKISVIFLIIGFVDLIYQRRKFKEDMKMSKQEVKDEFKNTEGDPQVKSQIRRKMQSASRRRMMEALPEADVVITNPTHFAVALKYEANQGKAPVVIAKGADYLAQEIKKRAKEHQIEIVENKPLARVLYHNVEVGAEIPSELYQTVAEILAYVYGLKGK